MSDLTPITREEALLDGQDLEPITRKEQFIKRIYDKTQEVPTPITREEWFLNKAGEGGSEVTVEQLNATENGTYSEPGKAYSPVIVEVPEPTLISKSITANGTYSASADNADGYSSVTVAVEGFKKKSIANTPTDIASFDDGTANPMPSLEISIEPVQSGSGDPSPSNMRPISGWSEADVTRCGVNLWDEEWEVGGYSETTGQKDSANDVIRCKNYIPVTPNTSYYCSYGNADKVCEVFYYDANKNYINFQVTIDGVVTTPNNCKYMTFRCRISYGTTYNNDISINYPSTDTSYHAYQGSTTSIPFHDNSDNPITVYGGTLNVTSGELRVDRANVVINENSNIGLWSTPQSPWVGFYYIPDPYMLIERTTDIKSNYLKGVDGTNGWYIYGVNGVLCVVFDEDVIGGRTLNDIKGFLATHPLQAVYPLATPQTYQITPTQVTTLLGQNNIFADCGQVLEGEYFVTL